MSRSIGLCCLAALVGCTQTTASEPAKAPHVPMMHRFPKVTGSVTMPSGGVAHVLLIPTSEYTDSRCVVVVNEQGQPLQPVCFGEQVSD